MRTSFLILFLLSLSACNFSSRQNNLLELGLKEQKIIERENAKTSLSLPYVLLISIDGYRYDYTKMYGPPNLKNFEKKSLHAESLIPVFPSKTFPNHYTLATGLYAENHGLVDNTFYDPEFDQTYKISERNKVQDGKWYGGEPLWSLFEKNGILTASFFWVGSEAEISGFRPTYYFDYDGKIAHDQRIDQVVTWLKLPPHKRPHFLTLYFSSVDDAGHQAGPKSEEVKKAVLDLDRQLGRLFSELAGLNLPINVIIVSDHGMENVDYAKADYIGKYIDLEKFNVSGGTTHLMLFAKDQQDIGPAYSALKKGNNFDSYLKKDIPGSLHYKNNHRIGDILLVARPPHVLSIRPQLGTNGATVGGTHGFDPARSKNMHAIFMAQGPGINSKKIKSFQNIHIYPFVSSLLGVKPSTKIDGKIEVLGPYLKR